MKKKIFVDNLAPKTTRETLEELFGKSGKVDSVTFPENPTDTSTKYAFVVMADSGEAKVAIRTLNNQHWNGYRLTVTSAGKVQATTGFTGRLPGRIVK